MFLGDRNVWLVGLTVLNVRVLVIVYCAEMAILGVIVRLVMLRV